MASTSPAPPKTKEQHSSAKPNNPPSTNSSGTRHERLCKICQHPRREDIDDDILRWRSPQDIVYDFDLTDRSAVYRHARATKLLSQRKQNLNPALERVIESVYDAKPSMNAVLKAMAIYARINGNEAYKAGFTDPPKQTIITHVTVHPDEGRACPDTGRTRATTTSNGSAGAPPCPGSSKNAATSTESAPTAVANGSAGALLAAPSSNPVQAAPSGQGFSPAEKNDVRSTTQGNPAGAREDVPTSGSPTIDFEPQNDDPSRTAAGQPVSEDEPKIDGFTSPLLPGVVFAEGYFPARERMRRIADAIIKVRPDLKDRFLFHSSVLIPLILLGWLLWSALLGIGSTASAATLAHLPWNASGSRSSSLSSSSSPSSTSDSFHPPLATSHSPLLFFYSLQNLRSQNANLLKTRSKSIFYSPQKRGFLQVCRRRDPSVTAATSG